MSYALQLGQLERHWHTAAISAAVVASVGGRADLPEWPELVARFDAELASEPSSMDTADRDLRDALGLSVKG